MLVAGKSALRDWKVTWIHVEKEGSNTVTRTNCVVFSSGKSYSFFGKREDFESLIQMAENLPGKNELLIIDGLTHDTEFRPLHNAAREWIDANREDRRLLIVSSMSYTEPRKTEIDQKNRIKCFHQISWTFEEYKEAIKSKKFYSNVQRALDASDTAKDILSRLGAKFFYAGGCARYMFQFTTAEVKHEIDFLTQSTSALQNLVTNG